MSKLCECHLLIEISVILNNCQLAFSFCDYFQVVYVWFQIFVKRAVMSMDLKVSKYDLGIFEITFSTLLQGFLLVGF